MPVDLVVDHSVQVDFSGSPDALQLQPGDRVQAQPRALPVPQVGHAGVQQLQGRAARHRHRAPGEPRVPREGRAREGRRLLSRHAGRHRLAHDDDQRPRHRRLGRRRHRGGGRHARPAGLFPHAGSRRRASHRRAARRRHRDRPRAAPSRRCCARRRSSASSSSSTARARRRCRWPDRATIANMAPEYGATMGFFPVDEETRRLSARHRPQRGACDALSRTTTRRRACSASREQGQIDYTRRSRARPLHASCPASPARSARRTASSCPT